MSAVDAPICCASHSTITGIVKLHQAVLDGLGPTFAGRLEALDLSHKTRVVGAYLEQLGARGKKSDDATPISRPARVAVHGLCELLERVHSTLDGLRAECTLHSRRYFYYWRTPDVEAALATLERQTAQLDQRIALAVQIVAHAP